MSEISIIEPSRLTRSPVRETFDRTSVTQVKLWRDCRRAWVNRYVLGYRTPQSEAQALGSDFHRAAEKVLKGELEVPPQVSVVTWDDDPRVREMLVSVLPSLPPRERRGSNRLLVEQEFYLAVGEPDENLPVMYGFIDMVDLAEEPVVVLDWKTISDFRYALKPYELLEDLQIATYARRIFVSNPDLLVVRVKHVAVLKPKPPRRMKASSRPASILLTREQDEKVWASIVGMVRGMAADHALVRERLCEVDDARGARDLIPAPHVRVVETPYGPKPVNEQGENPCEMYGGCAYRQLCGFVPRGEQIMGMLDDRMKAGTNGTSTTAATTPPIAPPPAAPAGSVAANWAIDDEALIAAGTKYTCSLGCGWTVQFPPDVEQVKRVLKMHRERACLASLSSPPAAAAPAPAPAPAATPAPAPAARRTLDSAMDAPAPAATPPPAAPAPAPVLTGAAPGQVHPPDGAPRTTTDEEAARLQEAAKGKGRGGKKAQQQQQQQAAGPAPAAAQAPTVTAAPAPSPAGTFWPGLVLFVGCGPEKGEMATQMADFLRPITDDLTTELGVAHWTSEADGSGRLIAKIREVASLWEPTESRAIRVDMAMHGAREILEALTPIARAVVR